MISRADKLLEGFKLGSLGAGGKPERGEDPMKIESVKQGTTEIDGEKCPYLFWKDPDGLFYHLAVDVVPPHIVVLLGKGKKDNKFALSFKGGTQLEATKTTTFGETWSVRLTYPVSYDDAVELFKKYSALIKEKGITGAVQTDYEFFYKTAAISSPVYSKWVVSRKKRKLRD